MFSTFFGSLNGSSARQEGDSQFVLYKQESSVRSRRNSSVRSKRNTQRSNSSKRNQTARTARSQRGERSSPSRSRRSSTVRSNRSSTSRSRRNTNNGRNSGYGDSNARSKRSATVRSKRNSFVRTKRNTNNSSERSNGRNTNKRGSSQRYRNGLKNGLKNGFKNGFNPFSGYNGSRGRSGNTGTLKANSRNHRDRDKDRNPMMNGNRNMVSGSGRQISRRWSQLDEQEYCFKRNAAKYREMISYHKFKRNFYVPSNACTSMSKQAVREWTEQNAITIKPGYSEYMMNDHLSRKHVLNGKVPNPVLEFDHVKWPNADDIAANLSKAFEAPTPIQSATWPLLLSGLNVIGIAQTGSGKTLAFLLPAIVHMRAQPKSKHPRVLIVLPTRELAQQVEEEINKFARSVSHVCCYGGASAGPQLGKINRGVQIVVATPGRLMDYISKGQINMGEVCDL